MFGVLGKGRETHLREFAFICGSFSVFGALGQPENGDLDRKWTQMAANGGGNSLRRGFLAGKQEGEGSETTKFAKNAKNGSENAKNGSRTLKRGLHTG